MASKDLLEKLFYVEHEAEQMVSQARDEAGRRVDAARTRAQKYYTYAYDSAMEKALAARTSSEAAARAEYESAVETLRDRLARSRLELAAFAAACEAALTELT